MFIQLFRLQSATPTRHGPQKLDQGVAEFSFAVERAEEPQGTSESPASWDVGAGGPENRASSVNSADEAPSTSLVTRTLRNNKLACKFRAHGGFRQLRSKACPGLPDHVPFGETVVLNGSCAEHVWMKASCVTQEHAMAEDLELEQPASSSYWQSCAGTLDQMGDRRWEHYNLMDAVQMVCGNRTCLPLPDCLQEVFHDLKRYPPDSLVGLARTFCETAEARFRDRWWFRAFEMVVRNLSMSKPHETPPRDALVVHLRLGDVLEESAASVQEMLDHPVPFYGGENENFSWNIYVRPLSSFSRAVPQTLVQSHRVILVASAVHAGRNTSVRLPKQLKSCHYLQAVGEHFRRLGAIDVSYRLGHAPDDDAPVRHCFLFDLLEASLGTWCQ